MSCVLAQAMVYGWLLPLDRVGRSVRFWFCLGCYASYPLVFESIISFRDWGLPAVLLIGESSIWPFPCNWLDWGVVPTVLFYLWCIDWTVVILMRCKRCRLWRKILAILLLPALTMGASYAGLWIGEQLMQPLF